MALKLSAEQPNMERLKGKTERKGLGQPDHAEKAGHIITYRQDRDQLGSPPEYAEASSLGGTVGGS